MLLFIITLIGSRFPLHRSSVIPLGAIIIATLCMATSCPDDDEILEPQYLFEEKVDLFPVRKTYALGDTIWLRYNNPGKKLLDKLSYQMIPADSVSLQFSLLYRCEECLRPNLGTPLCAFVTNPGTTFSTANYEFGQGAFLEFGCPPGSPYQFTLGIVLQLKGIFTIDLRTTTVVSCPAVTNRFPFSKLEYLFNLSDCNKDVYLTLPSNRRNTDTETRIDARQVYALSVQ